MTDQQAPGLWAESDDDSTPAELIERYLAGPALLRDTVAGMGTAQLHAKPILGKMSTQEVVNHIVDSELRMVRTHEARDRGGGASGHAGRAS